MNAPQRPEEMVGRPIPDATITAHDGRAYSLRRNIGRGPLVLFFYIRNGAPGWILELRELRAHHAAMRASGLCVAGVVREPVESNRRWVERLSLPFPLLADETGEVGHAFGVVRRIGIGGWNIEFFRRTTFLVDLHGRVAAVWGKVKVRGHAREIMKAAAALERSGEAEGSPPPERPDPRARGAFG